MKYSKKIIFWLMIFSSTFLAPIFLPRSVSAAPISAESLYKLSLLQGVEKCYDYAKDSIKRHKFSDFFSVFDVTGGWKKESSSDVSITTHVGNDLRSDNKADSDLSCQQVYEGYGASAKGLKNFYPSLPNTLEKVGYTFVSNEGASGQDSGTDAANSDQVKISFSVSDKSNKNTIETTRDGDNLTCNFEQNKNKKGKWQWVAKNCSGSTSLVYEKKMIFKLEAAEGVDDYDIALMLSVDQERTSEVVPLSHSYSLSDYIAKLPISDSRTAIKDSLKKSDFDNHLKENILKILFNKYYNEPKIDIAYNVISSSAGDKNNADSVYAPYGNDKRYASRIFLKNLGVDNDLPFVQADATPGDPPAIFYNWSNNFLYSLYYRYFLDITEKYGDIKINQCSKKEPKSAEYYFKNKSKQWCVINIPSSSIWAIHEIYSVKKNHLHLEEGTFLDVLNWFKKNSSYSGVTDYADAIIDENGASSPDSTEDDPADTEDDVEPDPCYDNAGPLGWVLCPAIEALDGIQRRAYDVIKEQFLEIKGSDIFAGEGNIESVWEIMRNISNIVFIIIILLVIVSQVTGAGINNYGIKKILPKLIICAILVNLSFFFSRMAVDLSNILGNSLESSLSGLAQGIEIDTSMAYSPSDAQVATVAGGSTIVSVVIGVLLNGGVGFVLLLVMVLVVFVIAVFFLFVILMVRHAAIIICIVIAPIAISFYILPNTEKVFKKWLDLIKNLLLVYPICGLVMGTGDFVSRLLGQTVTDETKWGMALAAMFAQVIPFFFIPTILKGSLAAMGNVGAKISNFGKGLSSRAQKGIRGSNAMKNSRQDAANRNRRILSGLDRDGNENRFGRFRRTLAGIGPNSKNRLRRLAQSREAVSKVNSQDQAAMDVFAEQEFANTTMPELEAAWSAAFDAGNTKRLNSLTNVMMSKYGSTAAGSIGTMLSRKQILQRDGNGQIMMDANGNRMVSQNAVKSLRALQDNMNHNSTFATNMKNKASDAFGMISNAGLSRESVTDPTTGRQVERNVMNDMSHFTANNRVSTDIKDWSTQSAATIQRSIEGKALDIDMARQIMSSSDPSVQSGIQSDRAKRDLLQAFIHNTDTNNPNGPLHNVGPAASDYRAARATNARTRQTQMDQLFDDIHEIRLRGNGGTPPTP